ncbi:thiol reductase thioredoxin, partial [Candidatus Woesebacteria bacterium RIFCSPLOWO2_01_FULL_37_19]
MTTQVVTDSDFENKVLKSEMPVLVDFWAPWCGPCKMAEPVLDELSITYKDKLNIMKLNVDENIQTSQKYDVMSIPTTI